MIKKWFVLLALVFLLSVAGFGCSDKTDISAEEPEANEPPEPVTLYLYTGTTLTEEEFHTFMAEPVKQKYPHITLELDRRDDVNTRELMAISGKMPDLIYDSDTLYWNEHGLNVLEPLDDYIRKHNFDVNTIKPHLQRSSKDRNSGKWSSMPFSGNFIINWLNKDVFDEFGVPYPLTLHTWEELLEMNRVMVAEKNGINYVGMYPDYHFLGQGMSLIYIDPANYKATVNTDEWRRILNVVKGTLDIPGFVQGTRYNYRRNEWIRDRNVAMVIATGNQMIGPLTELHNAGTPMNWDLGPFPNFSERLGVSPSTGGQRLILTNQGQHKDTAFQVMMHLLSEEVQTIVSRSGKVPSLQNPRVEEQFGTGIDSLKGKNIQAIFMTEPADAVESTEWNSTVGKSIMDRYIERIALEGMDINTALRQAEEEINIEMLRILSQ